MTEKEKQKQRAAFVHLGFTEEEIEEVMEADKRIDNGEKLFELNEEQKAASKAARITTGDKTQYKPKTREKIPNEDKLTIMQIIEDRLADFVETEGFDMITPEREMVFKYKGVKYKLTLSCPRT